ncbi:MAG: PA14 domain-containing protein [Caldilineaceae bacterium]
MRRFNSSPGRAQTARSGSTLLLVALLLTVAALSAGCVMQPISAAEMPPMLEAAGEPVIAVAPATATPGSTVYVAGAGWTPDDAVFVNLSTDIAGLDLETGALESTELQADTLDLTVAATIVDDDGRFQVSFLYPFEEPWSDRAEITIRAYSVDSDAIAEAPLGVLPGTPVTATPSTPTVTPSATATASPTVTPTPRAPATPTRRPSTELEYATVESAGLNVRTGPGPNFPVVTTMRRGDRFLVLGQSADTFWLFGQTERGNILGWVAARFTDFSGGPLPIVTPSAPPRPPRPSIPASPTPDMGAPDWRAEYFNNLSLSGVPTVVRTDRAVDFYWGYGSPDPRIQVNYFSARWVQTTYFAAGTYRFFADVDDGVRIWVDDRLVVDSWQAARGYVITGDISLEQGPHTVRVEYFELEQIAKIRVWWDRIGDVGPPDTYHEWRGEYFPNMTLSGAPTLVRNDPAIDFNWGWAGSPGQSIPTSQWSARWTRTLYFDSDRYRFRARYDDGMRVWLDGALIIDDWRDDSVRERSVDRDMGAGYHTVVVEYYQNRGFAEAHFWIDKIDDTPATPTSFSDWKGEYWSNRKLEGDPTVVRNDRRIDFNWGTGSPDSRIPSDNFSARWTRRVTFEPGWYRFKARSDDGIRAWIDDDRIIDEWRDGDGSREFTADRYLDGRYRIKVEYYERSGGALVEFNWERTSGPNTPTFTPTVTATPTNTPVPETPTPVPTRSPSAKVNPDAGPAGARITVSGGGFPSGATINIMLGSAVRASAAGAADATVYASTVANSVGNYSVTFDLPTTWPDGSEIPAGDLLVIVATENGSVSTAAIYEVRAPRPTVAPEPYAQVSPRSGGAGTPVTVSGGGFPANATVGIYLAGVAREAAMATSPNAYATGQTDGNGNYSITFNMPGNWPDSSPIQAGRLAVVAATADFSSQASTTFEFVTEQTNAAVRISPTSGGPGTVVTVNGEGYPPNATVEIFLGTPDQSIGAGDPFSFGRASTDRNGKFSTAITIPATWPNGQANTSPQLVVLAKVQGQDIQAAALFDFAVPPMSPTPTVAPTETPVVPPTPTPNPNARVSPPGGSGGTQVIVSGGGFPANTTVNVHLAAFDASPSSNRGYERYATTTTNANGDYSVGFSMPGSWPDGTAIATGNLLILVATDDFGVSTSVTFNYAGVSASEEQAAPTPTNTAVPEPTATPVPTDTAVPEPTATPIPTDAAVPEPTATPVPTDTAVPEPTATPIPTDTAVPELTAVTPVPTDTAVPEPVQGDQEACPGGSVRAGDRDGVVGVTARASPRHQRTSGRLAQAVRLFVMRCQRI